MLDLFSGLGGFSQAFRDAGHSVTTLDLGVDGDFHVDFKLDILAVQDIDELGNFDLVLASPPCTTFSVASISTHWAGGRGAYLPKTPASELGLHIAHHTFGLIERWGGKYVIENPRGVMRKVTRPPSGTVWYCQYGDSRAKPTDIWTNLPLTFKTCRNGATDHDAAPRGAKTGTQGISGAKNRSLIPYGLSKAILETMEKEFVHAW